MLINSIESHGSISKNNLTTALEDEARVKNEARNLSLEARSLSRRELATEQKETCSLLFTTFHPNSQNNKISANSQLTDELESTCSIQSTHIKESSDKFLADKHTKVSPDLLPDPTVETIGVTKVGNASVIESNNIGTQREPASKKIPRKKSGSSGAGILSFLSGYSPNILSPKEPRARDNCSTPSIKSGVTSRELLSAETSEINLRPRKKLKVNPKTGTLSSSPKLEANSSINMVEDLSRKSKTGCKSMIIQIKYNDAIGQKLDQLMNSNVSISPSQNPTLANKNSISHHGHIQNRAIHPLFLEKKLGYDVHSTKKETKKDLPPSEIPSSSILELTKRNLTRTRINSQNTLLYRSKKSENYTSTSRTAIMSEMKKFPGAIEPAWPWKGIVHIRGLSEEETLLSMGLNFKSIVSARAKKSKENAVDISSAENIIISISNNMPVSLVASAIKNLDSDRFPYIQSSIRLPIKHLESGLHAQRRLKKQLSMRAQQPSLKNSTSSEDEIPSPCSQPKTPVHPAITKAFASVANSISAFEKGECETQAWAQKYSPQKVEEVLQIGHEPYILKDWLSHMTVRSIEVSSTVTKQSANSKTEPCNKKRKSTKLDGFIIPTDEEEGDDLDEIEKHLAHDTCKSPGQTNRTIVRGGKLSIKRKKSSRTHSSILISGPHGCGKSAAIYAAAKELNFEVFEINSSSKRGGKDIMDRIGDMTMNHHVHNAATTSHLGSTDKDRNISEDLSMTEGEKSYQGNIKSTLQSNSSKPVIENFKEPGYTSQNSSRSRSKGRKKAKKARASKNQKQSLILIEEADIIFKEDINFWSTVENIIAVSKRPIIITCNDESVIPLSHKFFHAILRFRPPPVELAVDYILMIAAIEGHAIQREAVKALYEERRLDLRASIWELNFWCQFAVGDINRGLSWYHQRQNAPLYVGERMDRIRVISENTYQKGMGWLSQDILEGNLSHLEIEEVILNQTCEYWNFDIGDWEKSIGLGKWTEIFQKLYNDKDKHLIALNLFADYTETMSDSDLISDSLFGSENQVRQPSFL